LISADYERTDEVLISDASMQTEVPHATPLDHSQDVLTNARRMAGARESHVSQSGLFHVLDWAGVTPTSRLRVPAFGEPPPLQPPSE
jgi:hypothetical protein